MSKSSRFPDNEPELNQYFNRSVTYVSANDARLKVSPDNKKKANDGLSLWNAAYGLANDPATRTSINITNKDAQRENLKSILRVVYDDIPESVLTNTDRETLNLKARSKTRKKAPVPTTAPVGTVDHSKRLQITLHFRDSEAEGNKKPEGVRACQIWFKEGEEPKSEDELDFLAADTATPYVHHFDIEDKGKTITYWIRWENTRGETGPWGLPVTVTVPG